MRLNFALLRSERVEHALHVQDQPVVTLQVIHDMGQWAPDIAPDQIDQLRDSRRKPLNAQLVIDEHRADAGAREQIVHVVVGT